MSQSPNRQSGLRLLGWLPGFGQGRLATRLLGLLGFLAIAFFALTVFEAFSTRNEAVERGVTDVQEQARLVAAEFDSLVQEGEALLTSFAAAPYVQQATPDCDAVMRDVAARTRFKHITRMGPDGQGLCGSVPHVRRVNVRDRAYFQAVRSSADAVLSEPLTSRGSGRPVLVLARRVITDGQFAGAVLGSLPIDEATALVANTTVLAEASVTIVDRFGYVLTHTGSQRVELGRTYPDEAVLDRVLSDGSGAGRIKGEGDRIVGYAALGNPIKGPYAVVTLPQAAVTAAANDRMMRTVAWGVGIMLLGLGTVYWTLRDQVLRPVQNLLNIADRLATGDYASVEPRAGRWLPLEYARLGDRLAEVAGLIAARREAMQLNMRRLQGVLDNMPQGVAIFDADQRLVAANGAYADDLQMPPGLSAPGTPLADIVRHNAERGDYGAIDPSEAVRIWTERMKRGDTGDSERVTPDGRTFVVQGRPLPDGGHVVTFVDVTERKRLTETFAAFFQNAARRDIDLDARFQGLLDIGRRHFGVPTGLLARISGNAYDIQSVSGAGDDLVPGTRLDLSDMYCSTVVDWEQPVGFNKASSQGWTSHRCYTRFGVEAYVGAPVYVDGSLYGAINFHGAKPAGRAFDDSDFRVIRLMAQWVGTEIARDRDVGKLADAERALGEERAYLQAVIDASADAILPLDSDSSIVSVNPAAARLFAGSRAWLKGARLGDLVVTADRTSVANALAEVQQAGADTWRSLEVRARKADGGEFPADLDLAPMTLPEREMTLALIRDATARKQAEEAKNQFISVVSHELRTPLTSIVGSLGLIRGGAGGQVPPRAATLLEMAHRNATRLIGLVNDILDFERLRAGGVEVPLASIDLAAQLTEAEQTNAGYAEQAGCRLVVHKPEPMTVLANANRLQQVLSNLISNAAKFSPAGETVEVWAEHVGATAVITVRDCGSGIPESVRDRLFQPFVQADPSDTRKQQKGTGLGLTISRALVQHMGGTIWVNSEPGDTRFHVRLPLAGEDASG